MDKAFTAKWLCEQESAREHSGTTAPGNILWEEQLLASPVGGPAAGMAEILWEGDFSRIKMSPGDRDRWSFVCMCMCTRECVEGDKRWGGL